MSTLQQLGQGLSRAWAYLSEGWTQLQERAAHALTRFTPIRHGGALETAADQLAERSSRWGLLATEIRDDGRNLVVRLEAPGMEPDDFDISVVDDVLVIRGEKRLQREASEGHYHLMECAYGAFERAIQLPVPVDDSGARARYKRGVLQVSLPKSPAAGRRQVPVRPE